MLEYSVRPSIAHMEAYEVETIEANIIVNANENNYPTPEIIRQEVETLIKNFSFNRYPPMKSENLRELIARELGLDMHLIQISNGSSELLEKACYAFGGAGKKIAVPWPSFSMYGEYADLADSQALRYNLTEAGYVDPDVVIELCQKEKPALLIICNPNNPTGNYNPLALMEKIIANVSCPVIMDEAYMEFALGQEAETSTLSLLNKYDNFMVFRTFSKAYGLAGMRGGYGVGPRKLMDELSKVLLPYTVNAFTLKLAEIVYKNKAAYKEQINLILAERDKFAAELKNLGFEVFDTATNFVCFRPDKTLADKLQAAYVKKYGEDKTGLEAAGKFLFKELLAQSILTRDFTGHPILKGCLRITIGTPEENILILQAIKKAVA